MSEYNPVDELVAVMETLADWLDEFENNEDNDDEGYLVGWVSHETVAAVAQILELTQVIYAELQQAVAQINEFVGAMQVAKDEATRGTKLIVANAGDMRKFIQE